MDSDVIEEISNFERLVTEMLIFSFNTILITLLLIILLYIFWPRKDLKLII